MPRDFSSRTELQLWKTFAARICAMLLFQNGGRTGQRANARTHIARGEGLLRERLHDFYWQRHSAPTAPCTRYLKVSCKRGGGREFELASTPARFSGDASPKSKTPLGCCATSSSTPLLVVPTFCIAHRLPTARGTAACCAPLSRCSSWEHSRAARSEVSSPSVCPRWCA